MRNHFLDTSKALLIFLVVFGHFLERMIGWNFPESHTLLAVIYFVHMPAFIFISGLLFKDKNYIKNIIFFTALYIPFQFLFPVFDALWTGHFNWTLLQRPYWILWYLVAMICWTVLTHYLLKTKYPVWIAVFLAMMIGFSPWNNYDYSLGRIFTFLPFFVVGQVYGQKIMQSIQQFRYATATAILIFVTILSVVVITNISPYWLYGSLSYQQLKVDWLQGSLIRLGIYILSSLGIVAVFAIAHLFKNHFVQLGRNTLPVYLLHGFVVIRLSKYIHFHFHIAVNIVLCLLLSLLTCLVLQHAIFDRALRKLSLWLMKPTEKIWDR